MPKGTEFCTFGVIDLGSVSSADWFFFFLKEWIWKWLFWGEYVPGNYYPKRDRIKVVTWSHILCYIVCVQNNLIGHVVKGITVCTFDYLWLSSHFSWGCFVSFPKFMFSRSHVIAVSVLCPLASEDRNSYSKLLGRVEEKGGEGRRRVVLRVHLTLHSVSGFPSETDMAFLKCSIYWFLLEQRLVCMPIHFLS